MRNFLNSFSLGNMDKRIIMFVGLITLVGLGVFVCATMIKDSNGVYEVTIDLEKGWNIVAGTMPEEGILASSEIQLSDIKAMWYYSPLTKSYSQLYPEEIVDSELEIILFNRGVNVDDTILTSAVWVYSDKSGTIKYTTLEGYPALEERRLYEGWNFVSITGDFLTTLKNQNFGSCDIRKSYFYDIANQEWIVFPYSNIEGFTWEGDTILGYGLIIKVSSDCTLGTSTGDGTSPPPLPIETELPEGETISCEDSDGYDLYNVGIVSYSYEGGGEGAKGDYCDFYAEGAESRIGLLREGYCEGVTYKEDLVKCKEGYVCRAARCVEGDSSLPMCSDTDGGKDEFNAGYLVGIGGSGEDECYINGSMTSDCSGAGCSVYEYYCDGEIRAWEIMSCPNGCSEGACIQ